MRRPSRRSGEAAERPSEERVTPCRLRECAGIRQQRWDAALAAGRVVAVDEVAERIERGVLGERHRDGEPARVVRNARRSS